MRAIKNKLVIEDNWQLCGDEEPLPNTAVIVSWERWCREKAELLQFSHPVAIVINGSHQLPDLAPDLEHFKLIALDFPKLGDGRCFTHARLLRERYQYSGEIRAVGYVIHDLLFFMHRCGIDSFVLHEDKDPQSALKAFGEFSVRYQTAADQALPIYRLR